MRAERLAVASSFLLILFSWFVGEPVWCRQGNTQACVALTIFAWKPRARGPTLQARSPTAEARPRKPPCRDNPMVWGHDLERHRHGTLAQTLPKGMRVVYSLCTAGRRCHRSPA